MLVGLKEKIQPDKWKIADHVVKLETSIIREILKISSQPGVISFAGGLPAPELFPLEILKDLSAQVIDKYNFMCCQYSLSMGVKELREWIADYTTKQGMPTEIDNILITCGSQQGIELLARVFIEPGDYILTENPTYVGALQAFNYYRARYATVEMDSDGMLIDQVEEKINKYKPKLIYTISNFQNPTGITMSEDRRVELVKIATKYNIPLIDDNPYGELRFAGKPVPELKSYGGDQVVTLKTFSKIVAPGFRIAWMNATKSINRQFEKVKQCTDLHTNAFSQYLLYEFVSQGFLEPHIEKIKADYRKKRELMLKVLEDTFPEGVSWTKPEGGLFLWLELPSHISAKELLPKAIELKVAYVYGQPFFPGGEGENTMRLNFSNATLEGIEQGIKRLARLLKENM
ncbi:MAG: PLP-dependent aminotransferase family protein [candidate division Zixibacteria bacterium]|nr:PLP-dependent aminotransferase family protein [candidate division Zixibacteria bacterium]MDD5427149.1 PLP-dependent aminotransferase family protein [candidate division Zixibacteria bacterium]